MDADRLPASSAWPDEVFDDLAEGTPELRRVQLYSKGKAIDGGLIGPGRWGVPRGEEDVLDLGKAIDLLMFARRPKALDVADPNSSLIVYDPRHPDFARIRAGSDCRDSGCMYGVSFLVFERSTREMYELFFGTRSSRPEAKKLYRYLPRTQGEIAAKGLNEEPRGPLPVTFASTLVGERENARYIPQVAECRTPFGGPPVDERLIRQVEAFLAGDSRVNWPAH